MRVRVLTIGLFLAIVVCLFIGDGISYAKLEDGLISAWTFDDGSVNDFAGENHGEIKGGVEVVDGKFEKGLSFDGKDGHVIIPHDKSMEVIADGYSVSAWFLPRAITTGEGIVTKGEGSGWGIKYAFKITIDWWGVSNKTVEGYFNTSGALKQKPNKWVFACLTADGKQAVGYSAGENDKVEIRPNGRGNPHIIAGPYLIEADFPIEIGVARLQGGNVDAFVDGIIDEVYLWDRALTEEEVGLLAQGERPNFPRPVELAGKLSTLWGTIKNQ